MNPQDQIAQEIQQVEISLETAKSTYELGQALERLHDNPDFKKVIAEGYLEQEAIRLVSLAGHPSFQSVEDQAGLQRQINGVGAIRGYFHAIMQQAQVAGNAIDDYKSTLEELRGEG